MEPLPSRLMKRFLRQGSVLALALTAFVSMGCLKFLEKSVLVPVVEKPAPPVPPRVATKANQVVTMWNGKVAFAPNPLNGGAPLAGLSGRMYLFGPDGGYPVLVEGSVIIDMYDATVLGPNGEPRMIHQMRIDPATLKQWAKRDVFGDGYTLFLDWPHYTPDVRQVSITLRFDPSSGGNSLFHTSGTITMDHSASKDLLKRGVRFGQDLQPNPGALQVPGSNGNPNATLPAPLPLP